MTLESDDPGVPPTPKLANQCGGEEKEERIWGYYGIPYNVLLCISIFVILIVIFSVLRKYSGHRRRRSEKGVEGKKKDGQKKNKNMFSWMRKVFNLSEEDIMDRCGNDAVTFLTFEHYLIVLSALQMILCLSIALPVNFHGDGQVGSFENTTINHLARESPLRWVHSILSTVLCCTGYFFMSRFSKKVDIIEDDCDASSTLLISNIPVEHCTEANLKQYFQLNHGEHPVSKIEIAYDWKKLITLTTEKNYFQSAINGCTTKEVDAKKIKGHKHIGRVCYLGIACPFFRYFGRGKEFEFKKYYEERCQAFRGLIEEEHKKLGTEKTSGKVLGIAFVSFVKQPDAAEVKERHERDFSKWCSYFNSIESDSVLKPAQWTVQLSGRSDEIYWDNLPRSLWSQRIISLIINLILSFVIMMLTTPKMFTLILGYSEEFKWFQIGGGFIASFTPTIITMIVATVLPVLVAFTEEWVGHWTSSSKNLSIMRKTAVFLLFMVLFMRSLNFDNIYGLFQWLFDIVTDNDQESNHWACIFHPDNSAFYVNYLISACFIGSALELLGIFEFLVLTWRMMGTKSVAESDGVRDSVIMEFDYGVKYAWLILIFTVMTVYSVASPLITIFGCLYFVFKYFVDRYNLMYVYNKSRTKRRIHELSIIFVQIAFILLQGSLTVLSKPSIGFDAITIFNLSSLCIMVLVLVLRSLRNFKSKLFPAKSKTNGREKIDAIPQTFLPEIVAAELKRQIDTEIK